MLSNFF
jgi:hypothetical protein